MSSTIQQPQGIKAGLSLVVIDSVCFLNSLLENLFTNSGNNEFSYRSQEFHASLLDLLKKKRFFPMTTAMVLKNSKNAYLAKISIIMLLLIM